MRCNLPSASIINDTNGNITGSEGYYQDIVFYITGKLNMTVETIESTAFRMKLLDNGSWTGEIGILQRQEADVVSSGLGLSLQRSDFIDYPIATIRSRMTLLYLIPEEGVSPNMWVYVEVFVVYQWLIFLTLLVLMAMGLSVPPNSYCYYIRTNLPPP